MKVRQKYSEFAKNFYNNMYTGLILQNHNEFIDNNAQVPFELYIDSRFSPKIYPGCKLNVSFLDFMTPDGKIIDFNHNEYKGDYSIYIFCKYEYISVKFIEYLAKIKESIPHRYKNVFIVIEKSVVNKETFYTYEFKKLFENTLQNLEIVSFFKFLLMESDNDKKVSDINPYSLIMKADKFQYLVINQENVIIKIGSFICENIQKFGNKLKKYVNEEYLKEKEKKKRKEAEILYACINCKKRFKKLPYLLQFFYSFEGYAKISNDISYLIPVKISKLCIEGDLRLKEFEEFQNLLKSYNFKKFLYQVNLLEEFNIDLKEFKVIKSKNQHCAKIIPENEGVYYCYWCKIFYCENCVETTFLEKP